MNARSYQNILHTVGICASVLMIYGAVSVGKGESMGVILMIIGAGCQRITSEIEFHKQTKIVGERMRILAKYLMKHVEMVKK